MAVFPAELQALIPVGGFRQGGPMNATISTPMDFGAPKTRRRTTAAVKSVSVRLFPLTRAQFVAFETFFAVDLEMGALRFDMENPLTGVTHEYKFANVRDPYAAASDPRDPDAISVDFELLQLP